MARAVAVLAAPRFVLVAALASALSLSTAPAQAQVSASDKAAAEALFDEGLRLMREGKYVEACRRLERSQSIEHGLGTMLYLADCYERIGRTASAWALFREAASLADAEGQGERAESGRSRARALKPRLSWLTVDVPEANVVEGLRVSRDDEAIPQGAWGTPIPIDPGAYRIDAQAPGHTAWSTTVRVGEDASRVSVRVPKLEVDPEAEAEAPVASASEESEANETSPVQDAAPAPERRKLRLAGIAIGATGLAAAAAGAVFGGLAISRNNEAGDLCQGSTCDSQQGVNASEDARTYANVSTAMWVTGGALFATGLTLFLLDRKADQRAARLSPSAGPGHAGLLLWGAF